MRVVIFSGTTEGRALSAELAGLGAQVTAWVATEYGRALQAAPGVELHAGRLDAAGMARALAGADLCIDATHPYAREASRNIRQGAKIAGVPRLRLLAICCRTVTFIHDVDLELHALLKTAARRRERGRPRVQDQHRRKPAPQPSPCVLVRLSLKRLYGLRAKRLPERLEPFEDRILNLHRRAAHGVTPSHGRVPGSSSTAPGVSVPAGGRPGMPALPSATSRNQLSALV